jgi:hypothetical protein
MSRRPGNISKTVVPYIDIVPALPITAMSKSQKKTLLRRRSSFSLVEDTGSLVPLPAFPHCGRLQI